MGWEIIFSVIFLKNEYFLHRLHIVTNRKFISELMKQVSAPPFLTCNYFFLFPFINFIYHPENKKNYWSFRNMWFHYWKRVVGIFMSKCTFIFSITMCMQEGQIIKKHCAYKIISRILVSFLFTVSDTSFPVASPFLDTYFSKYAHGN